MVFIRFKVIVITPLSVVDMTCTKLPIQPAATPCERKLRSSITSCGIIGLLKTLEIRSDIYTSGAFKANWGKIKGFRVGSYPGLRII